MRLPLTLLMGLALVALAWPGSVAQAEAPVVLRVDGTELTSCDPAAARLVCFVPTEGDPATAFLSGQSVRVELTAAGQAPHSINVMMADDASPVNALSGTAFGTAIAQSAEVEGGAVATLDFTVPESGTLYFYCAVPDHEPLGMFFTAEIQPAPEPEPTEDNTTGDDNGTAPDDNTTDPDNTTAPEPSAEPPADPTDGDNATNEDGNGTDAPSADDTEDSPLPAWAVFAGLVGAVLVAARRRRGGA